MRFHLLIFVVSQLLSDVKGMGEKVAFFFTDKLRTNLGQFFPKESVP